MGIPLATLLDVNQQRTGAHHHLVASTSSALSETSFVSEEEFTKQITENPVVVVDWMAKWCRKCIYLKPKLERMLRDEFPGVPLVFIEVNRVPGGSCLTVYQDGEKVPEAYSSGTGLPCVWIRVEHTAPVAPTTDDTKSNLGSS
ncbi:hypothetical protein WJX84_005109 [Apatococcus fuscideae]|uniref:Thioredoxin domain-containing protein n=1 Tax=Apatococcus fuscideae TaxID=2026836 RepID=A0AAW1SNH8_9CHLO